MNNIKGYKLFESVKKLEDYKLTKSLYKFNMQTYFDRLFPKVWEVFEEMELYLQEYIDEDRLHCYITPTSNNMHNYDIRLSFNVSTKELNNSENIKDFSDILRKLSDASELMYLKYKIIPGHLGDREFVVLSIDLPWDKEL